jgi:hypothetical protein
VSKATRARPSASVFDREALHLRALVPAAPAPLVVGRVAPRELARRRPAAHEGPLPDDQLDVGAAHRRTEIGARDEVGLDAVAQAVDQSLALHLGQGQRDLELGQLVLLEPEQRRAADAAHAARTELVELHVVLAQRQARVQRQLGPGRSEGVERQLALLDLRAVRVADRVRQARARGRDRQAAALDARADLPLHRVLRPVGRTVRDRVQLPRLAAIRTYGRVPSETAARSPWVAKATSSPQFVRGSTRPA